MSNLFCYYNVCYYIYYNRTKMIKKKITQIGTSWGVIIPKAIIEGLGINPIIDEVEIYLENNMHICYNRNRAIRNM